jgi:hypothetical protein
MTTWLKDTLNTQFAKLVLSLTLLFLIVATVVKLVLWMYSIRTGGYVSL